MLRNNPDFLDRRASLVQYFLPCYREEDFKLSLRRQSVSKIQAFLILLVLISLSGLKSSFHVSNYCGKCSTLYIAVEVKFAPKFVTILVAASQHLTRSLQLKHVHCPTYT